MSSSTGKALMYLVRGKAVGMVMNVIDTVHGELMK